MKFTNKKMAEQSLERIQLIQQHIESVEYASSYLQRIDSYFKPDFGNIIERLLKEELTEWKNLFMWALTLNNEERDRIKVAAYNRYVSEKYDVSRWINNGLDLGRVFVADEKEFREMVKKVFSVD